jgi:hypothetical protein
VGPTCHYFLILQLLPHFPVCIYPHLSHPLPRHLPSTSACSSGRFRRRSFVLLAHRPLLPSSIGFRRMRRSLLQAPATNHLLALRRPTSHAPTTGLRVWSTSVVLQLHGSRTSLASHWWSRSALLPASTSPHTCSRGL